MIAFAWRAPEVIERAPGLCRQRRQWRRIKQIEHRQGVAGPVRVRAGRPCAWREYADLYESLAPGRVAQLAARVPIHGGKVTPLHSGLHRPTDPSLEDSGTVVITKELAHAAANATRRA